MIWWYRNVFIDRNMPLTGAVQETSQPLEIKNEQSVWRSIGNVLNRLITSYQEKAKLRYDWRIYKNLTDHQLEDIGLTRDDLRLLLQNKTPVMVQQRVRVVKNRRAVRLKSQLMRDSDIENTLTIPRGSICSNDCVDKVA